ncbi:hypothetical protein E1B28_000243 [Marasmius oreades]|uniref:Uncharacterized protein n=1 Tax=Marasmius oreades TaxID=181124 RepID=A0A9P8AEE2_9AGAR|nr:uncharacterized protein E1B28_000243 [Marasmius oreades]KAG7098280.1 hypothetical protein E1B28_000243 [Marasmius oreades]
MTALVQAPTSDTYGACPSEVSARPIDDVTVKSKAADPPRRLACLVTSSRPSGNRSHQVVATKTDKQHTQDWALVDLDSEKFDWKGFRGNVVNVGSNLEIRHKLMEKMCPHPQDSRHIQISQ